MAKSSQRPRTAIIGRFPEELREPLSMLLDAEFNNTGRGLQPDEIVAAAQGKSVLVVTATDAISSSLIARLPKDIRVIATYSLGKDHIAVDAAAEAGIAIVSVPDVLSESCADVAMLLMLGASRRALEGLELVRSGTWQGWEPGQLLGIDVHGSRLGILGMGRIGRAVARRAKAFHMQVDYHNRARLATDLEDGARYQSSLIHMLGTIDILCVACPGGDSTSGLIDERAIAHMRRGSVIVNISRGDVIVDDALVAALKSGQISAAGLDVFVGEPDIHPAYRSLPNVFALPHLGSSTLGTRRRMAGELGREILEALATVDPNVP